ncbi:MAG TPA: alpha/beta hydrolase-fold protein [Nocardioides sp.]
MTTTRVTLTWEETDPSRPAYDVVVRLVALTDAAYDAGELDGFRMRRGVDGVWEWDAELPSDLRTTYQLCPIRDRPLDDGPVDDDRWGEVMAAGEPDPNATEAIPPGCVFGSGPVPASVLSLPDAVPQPWAARREGIARGRVERHEWPDGSILHVHRPAGSADGSDGPTALAVVTDGHSMMALGIIDTLDNLAADRAVPALTTVVVESIQGAAPRGLERVASLATGAILEAFVDDLVPWVEERYAVSADPARRVIAGHSLGGLAALHLAVERPDVFGVAVVGSAALWWPGRDGQLVGADVVKAYAHGHDQTPPVTVWAEVGTEEDAGEGGLLRTNRDFRAAYTGGNLTYREVRGGHDLALWRGGLADGLAETLTRRG